MLQKYFLAIVPTNPLLLKIQDIKKDIFKTHGTKGALRSPGHITLHMPFNFNDDKENKLFSVLQQFHFPKEVKISLNGFSCFEPRVVFINVNEDETLFQLQSQLVQHVKKNLQLFNQSDSLRGFHPHITVAFRDLKKPQFYRVWEEYQHKFFESEFSCDSICLLKQIGEGWEVYKEFKFV